MVVVGRYIKFKDNGVKVVFIGLCIVKKSEILIDLIKDLIDYVLIFEELLVLFEVFEVNFLICEDIVVDDVLIFGRGFVMGGGLIVVIENYI